MLAIILFELTTTNTQNYNFLVSFDLWLDWLEFVYIGMLFNSLFVHVVNSITNYLLYIIILHRFENIRVQFNSPV